MASDNPGGFNSRDPYHRRDGDSQPPPARGPRNGPLASRIEQRSRTTQPPTKFGEASPNGPYSPYPAYAPYQQDARPSDPDPTASSEYVPTRASAAAPTWGRVTGQLKLDERVSGALHAELQFGANWTSRSEMLRACLDEYYRLVASYNDARHLLELSDGEVEALRREKMAATARLHELEARLELHSRTELRAVYLGAAEAETRHFRAEEERDLLRSRTEILEGFMAFLSRIIATVRAIPPNVVMNGDASANGASGANGANGAAPSAPAPSAPPSAASDQRVSGGPAVAPAGPAVEQPRTLNVSAEDFEELVLDEDEVALLPSNEFEIIEILDSGDGGNGVNGAASAAGVHGPVAAPDSSSPAAKSLPDGA